MLTEIRNEYLTAKFSDLGAELKSLTFNGDEYIWNGDEKYWSGSSPILFPICSGMKDDKYLFNGKEYPMSKHGFAKELLFQVETRKDNQIVFLLRDNEDTFKIYPFRFEFRITYTLINQSLVVDYDIKNLNEYDMFCSVGAHEGYLCAEGIEEYDIVFPKKVTLDHTFLTPENTLGYKKCNIVDNDEILPLSYKYFEVDALIFENISFESLILKNRNTGRAIRITFKDFSYLLLWSIPNAPFICVEPWCGITDREDCDRKIENKDGIIKIAPGKSITKTHSLEII